MRKTCTYALMVALALSASALSGPAIAQKVPQGKKFTLFNKGKAFKTLNPGQSVPSTLQCVQVPCPPNFDERVVCWKCESDGTGGGSGGGGSGGSPAR